MFPCVSISIAMFLCVAQECQKATKLDTIFNLYSPTYSL